MKHYDAIIIGTGQAGPTLAKRLAAADMRVAIIERDQFGGTCVNTGCTPTKTLVATARIANLIRRAPDYGLNPGSLEIDLKQVMKRKNEIVELYTGGVEKSLKSTENLDVYEGHARFTGPRAIQIEGKDLEADRVFINVGTRAVTPDFPGIDKVTVLTSSDMLELQEIPEHLIVVGGSYIGLEFGQMFRRFGSEVTIVERKSHLVSREDPDVSEAIEKILEAEGIEVRTNADCITVGKHPDGVQVGLTCEEGAPEVSGTHLLAATGRRPNTDDLGLEHAGIQTDPRGYIVVDDELRTNVEGVYALGDANGQGAFTHTSYNDHEIVADNLLNGDSRRVSDRLPAYALYIDPPLGRVGLTETQVRNSGREALIATRPMTRVSRAFEMGETAGFMKILVDAKTLEILGCSILGVAGDEVVHSVLDVMYAKAPYTVIQRAVHIHPTVTELIPTMLGDLKQLE